MKYLRDIAIVVLLTISINIFFFIWITIDALNSEGGGAFSLKNIPGGEDYPF